MPKQILKIDQFHGGLSSSSDPRDILDNELSGATDIMVDELGMIRSIGNTAAYLETLDNVGDGVTEVPGAGLFQFDHDRTGAEDAGDDEDERGDNYLALYDDADVQVWVYSNRVTDWDDDKDSPNNGVINFIGKSTSGAAKPNFISIDGSIRVSTGEFLKYDSASNLAEDVDVGETVITTTSGDNFTVGNYIQIDNEILYVTAVNTVTEAITTYKGMFGTKDVSHTNGTDIYIVNMNQWYGYVNNNFFQTSAGTSAYTTNKWYNVVQHLRSLDELGITVILDDASLDSPSTSDTDAYKIVVAYWRGKHGFWSGSYFLGLTPVYLGGQEGPLTSIGSDAIQLSDEILNIQLYIGNPTIGTLAISSHPLKDDRIIGLNLYTKSFVSDEWYLLKKFDFLQGGEHGWAGYDSNSETKTGFWKLTSTVDVLSLAAPSATTSYDGPSESNTCRATLYLNESKGANRQGLLRLSGFELSPLYENVDLSSTSSQDVDFDVINPSAGTHKLTVDLLDENYNVMKSVEIEQLITESAISPPSHADIDDGGYGSGSGGSS